MKRNILVFTILSILLLSSCTTTTTKGESYPLMYQEKPLSILIMPPINQSTNVDAKEFFYTTMNIPLAEAGYYVYPPNLTLDFLQSESAYDSELFINGSLYKFKEMIGADLIVFTIIKSWDKSLGYVKVEIEYILRSTTTGEILYQRDASLICNTTVNATSNFLANFIGTLIKTATTDYIDVARRCNKAALLDLPNGKYNPNYQKDMDEAANPIKIKMKVGG